jgi:hypothetical protein
VLWGEQLIIQERLATEFRSSADSYICVKCKHLATDFCHQVTGSAVLYVYA